MASFGPEESKMIKNYALIGAAGYIAPRHLEAIKKIGGNLAVAYDVNDSVGIMDRYFPNAAFFTNFESFDTFTSNLKRFGQGIDYIGICSPNYLHKHHISYALRSQTDAICEKPLVLDPSDIDDLAILELETGRKISSILQLRLHQSIIDLKQKVLNGPKDKIYDVDLGYFTSRGAWYHTSWKGSDNKSGGIATNIGVHFYDMLSFVFGSVIESVVHYRGPDAAAGYIELEKARVRWVLSINRDHLPTQTPINQTTHRSITVEGEEIEFSGGFTELHTASYQNILDGNGFGLEIVRPSIELVSQIRTSPIELSRGEQHPDIRKLLKS